MPWMVVKRDNDRQLQGTGTVVKVGVDDLPNVRPMYVFAYSGLGLNHWSGKLDPVVGSARRVHAEHGRTAGQP